ncbi:hypothetical protein [Halobacillus aidingensis]|uniref:Phage-related protein n=1 Tax=Halobacillus aidingensis TaxID=240303 RepID=A0A1H0MJ59_HALAD|nr:hypothetical protein [Halobacillus aidingensis]SDO80479.1 hypothetical protein SAMN05421677_10855 [Halobacillus aidingensis]
MLKEFAQYLVKLGTPDVLTVNEQQYSTQPLQLLKKPTPSTIGVRSLSGLVDYIQSEFDGSIPLMIHVESPTRVKVFSQTNVDEERDHVIVADAMIPEFRFDQFYDTEAFNIKLQSCFVKNEDRDIMLKVVGSIKEEGVQEVGDDGISQAVTARTGVATVGNVKVPNPVELAPRRTFVEVEQPESDFVFRMRQGPKCALFEADGGAWELEAMENIADYLESSLEAQANRIHIIS